jgi:DNA-binding MarR family transcriptional regulator
MKTIEEAIHQRQFADLYVKTDINITYTSSCLSAEKVRLLRPLDLTPQQFNILRILRGVNPGAVSVRYLAERMVDQTSNASRLVDKLVEKGWVDRKGCPTDRRQVEIRITPAGLEQVARASEVIRLGQQAYAVLSDQEMEALNGMLDKLRNHLNP